jgi:hypothetical protein
LQRAASIASSEGEVWWRVFVDQDTHDHPIIEWHSRAAVIPLWRGRRLLACAFISELDGEPEAPGRARRVNDPDLDPAGQAAWIEGHAADPNRVADRYVTIHSDGLIRNLLYRGRRDRVGERIALTGRNETADLRDEWNHGLGVMLAGRVLNRSSSRTGPAGVGASDFHGVRFLMYGLNEVTTIGHENARMTLLDRAVIPEDAVERDEETGRMRVPMGKHFLVVRPGNEGLSEANAPWRVLQHQFDAQALTLWDGHLTDRFSPGRAWPHSSSAGTRRAQRPARRSARASRSGGS